MKTKKLIFILFLMLVCINLPFVLGAGSFLINQPYDSLNISLPGIYKTDSIVLRITTSSEVDCFYDSLNYPLTPLGVHGLTHEVYLENLGEGFHKYYVRCGVDNPREISFTTSIPIFATIKISKNPPLGEGQYKITLRTSKTSLGTPILKYSFDELVYRPISLIGSGTNWEGNLIVPGSTGEAVCSFTFEAWDLSGEEKGTRIEGDNSFIVDTSKPSMISIINAVGYEGQIKLSWFFDENVKEFNIYKSENSQVDYTEFYKTSTKDYFYDNDVEKGKTYYYRVAAVDEAGNVADLSKEVYATALLNNYSSQSGLNPSLVGKVDNTMTEIESVLANINQIKSLTESQSDEEKILFKDIKLDKNLDGVVSQLNSLERDVESYKLQDLSESELNSKLSAATLKLNILKKQIPESITIIDKKQLDRVLDENTIQKAFLEYSPNSDYDYKKEIAQTIKIIQDNNIKISSNFYNLEITYLDGTKNDITLVKDIINSSNSSLGKMSNLYFLSSIPKEIAEKSSELKFMNLEYNVIKDDPVISFKSDTDKIIYYIGKEISLDSLNDISISPLKLLDNETKNSITGNSILNSVSNGSLGIISLVIFAFILGIYFLKIKNESSIKPVLKIMEDIKKVQELIKNGKEEEGKELYKLVKEAYKLLSEREKEFVVENIKKMNEGISK